MPSVGNPTLLTGLFDQRVFSLLAPVVLGKIIDPDPTRVALLIQNLGAGTTGFRFAPYTGGINSFQLTPQHNPLLLTIRDVGDLVQREWSVIQIVGGGTAVITCTSFIPQRAGNWSDKK